MSKKNEELHKMRAQILNLRCAGMTLATAIHYFPPCGRPGGCKGECPEARAALQEIYENMNELMLAVRLAIAAVFVPDPEPWDFLRGLNDESPCGVSLMADFGRYCYPHQQEFIRFWGEMDGQMMDLFGAEFSEEEWKALTARGAWQKGRRVPQVLELLKYLEDQIRIQCDLYESVLYGGMLGNCKLGQWAAKQKAAQA